MKLKRAGSKEFSTPHGKLLRVVLWTLWQPTISIELSVVFKARKHNDKNKQFKINTFDYI